MNKFLQEGNIVGEAAETVFSAPMAPAPGTAEDAAVRILTGTAVVGKQEEDVEVAHRPEPR